MKCDICRQLIRFWQKKVPFYKLCESNPEWQYQLYAHYKCWIKYRDEEYEAPSIIEKPPKEWLSFQTNEEFEYTSGLVTIPQFSKIVDIFGISNGGVTKLALRKILDNDEIETYTKFGYIKYDTDYDLYILTTKGRKAFFQNLEFREKVKEKQKDIKKEIMKDAPPFEVTSKQISTEAIVDNYDKSRLIQVSDFTTNKEVIELVRVADALMQRGVDPLKLLKNKLQQIKALDKYRYRDVPRSFILKEEE